MLKAIPRGLARARGRTRVALCGAGAMTLFALAAAIPPGASAQSDSTAVTIPGAPMTVYVGPRGECQSSYTIAGQVAGNYYFGPNPVGDCGFFLAFPKEVGVKKNPVSLAGKTFGFEGQAGPRGLEEYEPGPQSPVTGNGSTATPYSQTTTFFVKPEATKLAEVTETTTYINGQPQFTSTYSVKNIGGNKFYARALYAGDLYVNGNDLGIGVFGGGPPRFIGGQNTNSGVVGGFVEASPWANWQEAYWSEPFGGLSEGDNGIWHDIEHSFEPEGATVFNNTIEPQEVDNGAGVEFAQNLESGVEPKRLDRVHDHQPHPGAGPAEIQPAHAVVDSRADREHRRHGARHRRAAVRRQGDPLHDQRRQPAERLGEHERRRSGDDQLRGQQPRRRHDPDVPGPQRQLRPRT